MRSIIINYLRGDLRRNRAVTLVLVAVLTLSAVLVTGGAMVLERSAGAVERLFMRRETTALPANAPGRVRRARAQRVRRSPPGNRLLAH